jgi:hypothetical protein
MERNKNVSIIKFMMKRFFFFFFTVVAALLKKFSSFYGTLSLIHKS